MTLVDFFVHHYLLTLVVICGIIESWKSIPNKGPLPETQKGAIIMSPISEAQRKAVRKYNEKAYDRIELKVAKGRKAELQDYAQQQGESLNGLINRAIAELLEREQAAG